MRNRMDAVVMIIALLLIRVFAYAEEQKNPGTLAYDFAKIADGVYFATPNGKMAVINNSVVIVNEKEVMLVDSSSSPAAARALIADIKTLTDKPIRYVVDTHFHWDHAHGNQLFGPEVEIIGHEYTREQLLGDILNSKTYMAFIGSYPQQIKELQSQIATETDPKKREEKQNALKMMVGFNSVEAETRPTPPNLTFRDHMTFFRGSREIRLMFLGIGHTGGDIFIYLPKEKILCTGDFIYSSPSYMGDGYVDEWDDTLEKLKSIDFDIILPGHGNPMRTKEKIEHFQAYLRDLWSKTVDMKRKGLSAEEAAKKIDLTAHRKNYPEITGPGEDILAIERIYQLLESRDKTSN
jgi:cyclase